MTGIIKVLNLLKKTLDYMEMVSIADFYYADKTLVIKELLDSRTKVSLITRPRRFGKTLGLSTIQTFFEDERDINGNKIDNLHYFAGKKIMDAGEQYVREVLKKILDFYQVKWKKCFGFMK